MAEAVPQPSEGFVAVGRPIGVLIAEDDAALREALAALIEGEPTLSLLGAAADANEAIALAHATKPDVAIVDVRMPGGGGARAARELRQVSPETRVVALSGSDDRSTVLEMLQAGVVGYLVKGGSTDRILETIADAASGRSSLSVEVTGGVIKELVEQLATRRRRGQRLERARWRLHRAIKDDRMLHVVGQRICDLDSLEPVGVEALARFKGPPRRGPHLWFAEASAVGLRTQL